MDTSIDKLIQKIDQENRLFKNKSALDGAQVPKNIIGRQEQMEQLIRFLHVQKHGSITPFVSVYGRSGSGKSTLVRFVCDNMEELSYCFVNLRHAKTIFGCANLILSELGHSNLKSAQGLGFAIDTIEQAIISKLKNQKKNSFALVLDEFDVIFYDKRNNPSDFVYKLVILGEKLKKKNYQMCIIGISNNVVSDYELDDRVRSRIGNSETFFPPYTQQEALEILQDRAHHAFGDEIKADVLQYCAKIGAQEHGDARRVIDLLRIGAEIAGNKGQKLVKSHIDLASAKLQNERVVEIMNASSNQFKFVCGAIADLTFLSNDDWHYTSEIYTKYKKILPSDAKPLSYRRVSEILIDIENTGLISSYTHSRGKRGYGTQYKLLFPPEMIGRAISEKWWNQIENIRKNNEQRAIAKTHYKKLIKTLPDLSDNPLIKTLAEF